MARSKTLLITIANTNSKVNALEVSIFYDEGGMNYFNGGVNRRGYYASVVPTLVRRENGYTSRTTQMFEGAKTLLLEVPRFSQKTFDNLNFNMSEVHSLVKQYTSGQYLPCYYFSGEFVQFEFEG